MEVMKQLRQQAIRDLLEEHSIRTQHELVAALRERGFRATQATVSRDVAELGLVKLSRGGVQAYALPPRMEEVELTGEERLRKLLHDLPIEIRQAGLLLVVRTVPAARTRLLRRSIGHAGPRSREASPETTPSSSPSPIAARCSAPGGAWFVSPSNRRVPPAAANLTDFKDTLKTGRRPS